MMRTDRGVKAREWLVKMLLLTALLVGLPASSIGQTEDEDERNRGFQFVGVKYGTVDQGGWASDALTYKAYDDKAVLSGFDSTGSIGVEGIWELGSGFGLQATFERVSHEFAFVSDVFFTCVADCGSNRPVQVGYPKSATADLSQRTFGLAFVGISELRRSVRLYYGLGYAVVNNTASVNADRPPGDRSDVLHEALLEGMFLHALRATEIELLDYVNAVAIYGLHDLLPPEPPQLDGLYPVVGLLHTPRDGRFTWGGNLEYFIESESMNVNVLLGFRF